MEQEETEDTVQPEAAFRRQRVVKDGRRDVLIIGGEVVVEQD